MPLPASFKTKEEIPAFLVDDYEEKGGEWVKKEDESAAAQQAALKSERERRDAAEKLAKKTADELKKLQTEQKAREGGITDEKLAEMRAAVRKEVEDEYAPKLQAGEKAQAENRSLKLDSQIKQLAAKAGFKGDKLDDYWKLHGEEFDLTDDGKPMVKANPGQTVEKLIETHKAKRLEWTEGTKAAGGGAAGVTTGTGAAAPSVDAVLANPAQALAAARASGATL